MTDDSVTRPEVDDARQLGKRLNQDQVIIIALDHEDRTMTYASWGRTEDLCDHARDLADAAWNTIRNILTHA
jgi:hypothetical protein